jgi:hypothetical protein
MDKFVGTSIKNYLGVSRALFAVLEFCIVSYELLQGPFQALELTK